IRCEKAALHMQDIGIERVHQLEGGILKYLELTDGAHWQGDCFVFDGRGAIDKQLLPSPPLPFGERIEVRGQSCAEVDAKPAMLPLPAGERAGVRGHAGEKLLPERALGNSPASLGPSPQSSPRRGEEANAKSAALHWGGA